MKITGKPNKKLILTAISAVLIVVLVVGGSLAAYTRQDYQRGVVRNRDNEVVRFSANYMQLCASNTTESAYPVKQILYSDDKKTDSPDEKIVLNINVYNYVQGNAALVSEKDITYDMTIKLVNMSHNSSEYTVALGNQNITGSVSADGKSITYTATSTLSGRTPGSDSYTVTIYGKDIDAINIYALARPKDTSITGNQMLAADITPCTESTVQAFSCTGVFADEAAGDPKDFDALNYEVSISSGRAKVTVFWDSTKVEIDKYFLEKLADRDSAYQLDGGSQYTLDTGSAIKNRTTLTFIMDQTSGAGDYLIPFYLKTNKTDLDDKTWDGLQIEELDNVSDGWIGVVGEEIELTDQLSLDDQAD